MFHPLCGLFFVPLSSLRHPTTHDDGILLAIRCHSHGDLQQLANTTTEPDQPFCNQITMHLSTISSWSYVLDGRQSVRWFKKSYGLSIRNVFWKCSKRKTASQQIIRSKCSIFQDHQLHPNCWSQKRSSSQLETSQHLPWPILARKYIHYTPNRPWGTRRKSDRKISLISLCSTKINKGQRCIAFKKKSSPKSLKPLALNLLKVGHVLEWLRHQHVSPSEGKLYCQVLWSKCQLMISCGYLRILNGNPN